MTLKHVILQVGWSTTKDYHTFVWVEPCQDGAGQETVTMQAAFRGEEQQLLVSLQQKLFSHVWNEHWDQSAAAETVVV